MSLEDLNISLLCLHVFARMFNEQRKLFYFFASYCMMGQLLCCCHLLSQLYKSILVSEKVAFFWGGGVCSSISWSSVTSTTSNRSTSQWS